MQAEVLTYPSINGDVNVNKYHNGYVDALQGKKGWGEGEYVNQHKSISDYYLQQRLEKKK